MGSYDFIDFKGCRIIVTGASSGIGRAIAIELNRLNASVVLIGRNQKNLEETASLLLNKDHQVSCMDLDDLPSIVPKIKNLVSSSGPIYGLCHAAGIVETKPLATFNHKTFQRILNVNFTAAIELSRVVTRRDVMLPDGGAILFISSIYHLIGMPGEIGYSATKGAIRSAARAMAIELARRRIRVNTLSPGMVRTPMTDDALANLPQNSVETLRQSHPLGFGTPEDIARGAAFLLAPVNKWITGIDLVIDGGRTAH